MNVDKREKLAEYLYPTYEIMVFMCLDVYPELLKVIPASSCVSNYNLSPNTRKKNLLLVKDAISKFLMYNIEYRQILFEYYRHQNISIIEYDILIGLVLFVTTIKKRYYNIDIFTSKKSICFGQVSIIEYL